MVSFIWSSSLLYLFVFSLSPLSLISSHFLSWLFTIPLALSAMTCACIPYMKTCVHRNFYMECSYPKGVAADLADCPIC